MIQPRHSEDLESVLKFAALEIHGSQHKRELVQQSDLYHGDFSKLRQDYISLERKFEAELKDAIGKQKAIIERDLARTRSRLQIIDELETYQAQLNLTLSFSGASQSTLHEIYKKYRPEAKQRENSGFLTFNPYPETA